MLRWTSHGLRWRSLQACRCWLACRSRSAGRVRGSWCAGCSCSRSSRRRSGWAGCTGFRRCGCAAITSWMTSSGSAPRCSHWGWRSAWCWPGSWCGGASTSTGHAATGHDRGACPAGPPRDVVSYAAGTPQGPLVSWLQKLTTPKIRTEGAPARGKVPEGVWEKCAGCGIGLYRPELERNLMVCPKCGHHHAIVARARLGALLDENSGQELWASLEPTDPLKFRDSKKYRDRIVATQKKLGEKDAMVAMSGKLKGRALMAVAFEFAYMGGSMGSVVGEKFARAAERALADKSALVCFSAPGGRHV